MARPATVTAAPCSAPLDQRIDTPRRFSASTTGDTASSSTKPRPATTLIIVAARPGAIPNSVRR